ncbi:MAG: Uma2 family endonuclease, partial [Anaerolineae bacterium]|nr:Uma2 family endonuclease [Anaerolineae bacterium]
LHVYDGQEGNMPAPTPQHQEIVTRIMLFIGGLFGAKGLFTSPIDVLLGDELIQPDILWVSPDNTRCEITNRRMIGAPDLIIEILSPSTHKQDRVAKFDIYEAHGVGEYWIVDPDVQIIEVYIREDDHLRRQGGYTLGGMFTSRTLNNALVDVSALLG